MELENVDSLHANQHIMFKNNYLSKGAIELKKVIHSYSCNMLSMYNKCTHEKFSSLILWVTYLNMTHIIIYRLEFAADKVRLNRMKCSFPCHSKKTLILSRGFGHPLLLMSECLFWYALSMTSFTRG